jgi:hypothetical protein
MTLKLPKLNTGELNAGLLFLNSKPSHWLTLLPGEAKAVTWKKATAWAAKQGGELPTRKEQALIFANAAEALEETWYWSSEQRASDERYAWAQYFNDGTQDYHDKGSKLRARAVRKVPV